MLNECNFIGNVTRKPEVGTTEGGVKYARFTIACNERGYKKQDGTEVPERVEFVPCTAWRGQAETLEKFVDKGKLIYVKGRFHTMQYKDATTGENRYYSDVQVSQVLLLGQKQGSAPVAPVEPERQTQANEQTIPPAAVSDGDLPF